MTIVQFFTQPVERITAMESKIKSKEELITKAEVDLNVAKVALNKEKESLKEKETAVEELITSQKQKAAKESELIEELKLTKDMLNKAHQELKNKTHVLNAELEKINVNKVSTHIESAKNDVSNVNKEEFKASNKDKLKETPCKYFQNLKGCRRGSKCWFYHDETKKVQNKSIKLKQKPTKNFKDEQNIDKEPVQEQGSHLKQVILGLLKLLLRENCI